MTKRRLPLILITVLIVIACALGFSACTNGESPVESVIVSSLPKIVYYRGDPFALNGAKITVYYENGTSKVVPLDLTMISDFDAEKTGEQILTVSYKGKAAYLKVSVIDAPMYAIALDASSDFRRNYVVGQALDTTGMKLKITYTNGYTETVDVTEEMISGFDPEILGERVVTVLYTKGNQTLTTTLNLTGEPKSIFNLELFAPDKLRYVVGQTLDLTGGYLRVSYNDNTAERLYFADLYGTNPDFKVFIGEAETLTFTEANWGTNVKVVYKGIEKLFTANVVDVAVKTLELKTPPADQIKNGTLNLSAGVLLVTYNNDETEEVSLTDPRVTNNIENTQFDINTKGTYTVRFYFQNVSIDVDIEVIDAQESELLLFLPDVTYFQDMGEIDYTTWEYSIVLSNGSLRALDQFGSTRANLSRDVSAFVQLDAAYNNDFTTTVPGTRTYRFTYTSADRKTVLTKTVDVSIVAKEIVGVDYFKAPDASTYMAGDTLKLAGGEVRFIYNSGETTPIIPLTRDMFSDEVYNNATQTAAESVTVPFTYVNTVYNSSFTHSFNIKVLPRVLSVQLNASSSHKTRGVQGTYFDPANLIVDVTYPDGVVHNVTVFDSNRWTFVNNYFENVGQHEVRVYYGDVNDVSNTNYVSIIVTVTNDITAIRFADGFLDQDGYGFADIIEGQTVTIGENAYIEVTYENNAIIPEGLLRVPISYSMLSEARTYNQVTGKRPVVITYAGMNLTAYVNVRSRTIGTGSITVIKDADKTRYAKVETLSLEGMRLEITYDNGSVYILNLVDGTLVYANGDKEEFAIDIDFDPTLTEGVNFVEKTVTITVSLNINDNGTLLDGGEDTISFNTYWFDKLPLYITLLDGSATLPTIDACEGVDEIVFPANARLKVVYASGDPDYYYLNEFYEASENYLAPENYTITGFDSGSVRNQTLTFSYLMYECTFTVRVRPKVLVDISADKTSITVIEGMLIDSEQLVITAHYVDALGREFADPSYRYVKIELVDVMSDYDPSAEVVFVNNRFVTDVTFTFGTKSVTVELVIIRKTLTSITLSQYPRQIYTEFHSEGISYTGGVLLAYYNNGTSEFINLDSGIGNLEIDASEFNPNIEINNNNELAQRIYISYTVNGVEKSTSYLVTIRDRKYLAVEFSDTSTVLDGAYQLVYGATVTSRPEFYVMHGTSVFISNSNIDTKIAENSGFTVMYRNSLGAENASFPKDAGLYTMVIRYTGDREFNAFTDTSAKIRINPRKIYINAQAAQSTYGDPAPTFTFNITTGETDGNVLVFGETAEQILSVAYEVYLDNILQNFAQGVVSFAVSDASRIYKIRPGLGSEGVKYENYRIVAYNEAVFTVKPLPIVIRANNETKVYGQSDPAFRYDVYLYDGEDNDVKIGERTISGGTSISTVTINGLTIDISNYNLIRNLNLANAEDVGEHSILAGPAAALGNFTLMEYTPGTLTITKKSITIKGNAVSKEYGAVTPDIAFSTLNANDLVNSSALRIYDTFESVFGDYAMPDNYILEIYASSDSGHLNNLARLINGKYGLPYDAPVGIYNVYLIINNELITNYNVSVNPVTLTVTKANVKVFVNDVEKVYGAADPAFIYGNNYYYEFGANYLLDETYLVSQFTRAAGKDIGKYAISLTAQTYTDNSDFEIALYGQDINTPTPYLYITPRNIIITRTSDEEVYAKKVLNALTAPYSIASEDGVYTISPEDQAEIRAAITFKWKGRTDRIQGTGFAVVDIYDGTMTYNYLASRNFWVVEWETSLAEAERTRVLNLIDAYVYDGVDFASGEQISLTENFVYTINPKPLTIEVINPLSVYNFDNRIINLIFTDLSAEVYAGDIVTITPEILAVYEGTSQQVTAQTLYNAGVYTITVADIGNFNYTLANPAYVREIEILPIEVKIVIKNTTPKVNGLGQVEYYYTSDTYDGRLKQPYDFIWISNINEQGDENLSGQGYFYTESYKIVSRGLAGAPNTLTIYPYALDTNGNRTYPKDAGVYQLYADINETYRNYSVRFVSPVDNNADAEYRFVINQRLVKIINLNSYNVREYDGTGPGIPSGANIFADGDVNNEQINVRTDISFTFERDMSYIPAYLAPYITAEDRTSAGYFTISVHYSKSNNYIFELEGVSHYIIKRKNIEVALNASNVILSRQYDTNAPAATASQLTLIGGTAAYYNFDVNGVQLQLNILAFWNSTNSTWTQSIPTNYPVGYYAYTITPRIRTGETFTGFAPEHSYDTFGTSSGRKLLDWNHTYTIVAPSTAVLTSYGINAMYPESEGIYRIERRNVVLSVPGGLVESRKINNVTTNAYVYYQSYNGTPISYVDVLTFMNSYQVVDESYNPIAVELGFTRGAMTSTGIPASIVNSGEFYMLDVTDIESLNPNFRIMYTSVVYEIKKLDVELTLTAVNGAQGSTMVYGTEYNNLTFVLDFYDKAAFIAALGLGISPSQLDINTYISKPEGDPQRIFTGNNVYQLLDAQGNALFSTSDVVHANIPRGIYTPQVLYMADYSQNFHFTFVPASFEVRPKVITLRGIERTYFRNDTKFAYDVSHTLTSGEMSTVNSLLNEVLAKFMNTTGINITSLAGGFISGDPIYGGYYLRAIKNDITSVLSQQRYINYDIDFDTNDIGAILGMTDAFTYIPLTINKQELKVRVAKPGVTLGETVTYNDSIQMTFGENLYGLNNRYYVYVDGFAPLDLYATDYNYDAESIAQLEVRMSIIGNILKLSQLFDRMRTSQYNNGQVDTLDLSEYYDASYSLTDTFTNYRVVLDRVYYVVNKIDIYLRLVNLYNPNGAFEVLYSELEDFMYSINDYAPTRLDMGIQIVNPESIINYSGAGSFLELLMMMNVLNDSMTPINSTQMIINAIEYVITQNSSKFYVYNTINPNSGKRDTDGVKTQAGSAQLQLTNEASNKWYYCLGYNLICQPVDIFVYPEVKGLGEENGLTYAIPYSGVPLIGNERDFGSFIENLSMYVRLNYQGNPVMNYEYVDVKVTELRDSTYYNNYRRSWTINVLSDENEIFVGNEISMSITYSETFFFGTPVQKVNTLVSNEFRVRLYRIEDQNLIAGNSYFTYGSNNYNYGDAITTNHTYALGTYVQSDTGAYLVKNWRGVNYYTEILPALRYNYQPYVDAAGLYVKANIPGHGEGYYLIVNESRYNIVWLGNPEGNYLRINDALSCTPEYVPITPEMRYRDAGLTIQDPEGDFLKVVCSHGDVYSILIFPGDRAFRTQQSDPEGEYMRVMIDGTEYEVHIETGYNTYNLYQQSGTGNLLRVDIFSNIYYEEILSANRYDKTDFVGTYDILDTRFRIDPNSNTTSYYIDFIFFNDGTHDLYLRVDSTGYYLYLGSTLLDSAASIDELDLFDSFSHSMTLYIDKVGSYDYIEEIRNFYVILVIDDCYYIRLSTGTAITEFGSTASYAKIVTNEISVTFTRFEAIAMGLNTFSTRNFIADILLLPNTVKSEVFKNYSYHITIPASGAQTVEINLADLFVMGSINSVFGYNPDNYFLVYYVDGELAYTTSKDNPLGLIPVYTFAKGIYNITIKVFVKYTGDPGNTFYEEATKTIKLSVSQNYTRVELPDENNGLNQRAAGVSNPISYTPATGLYKSYFTNEAVDIRYNKIVFDFVPNESVEKYYLRYILKTSDASVDMLNYISTENYYGLMLEHSYQSGVYSTKLYMRYQDMLWTFDLGGLLIEGVDAWIGARNVLEVLYVENNKYLVISLSRGSETIFLHKIYNNSPIALPGVSADDIARIINTDQSFSGLQLHNAAVKLYKYEVGFRMLGAVDFVDNSNNSFISGVSTIESNTKVLISNGDGTAYVSAAKNFLIRFKASALNAYNDVRDEELIRFVIANNTSRLMPMQAYDENTLTSDRGIYLSIVNISSTQRELRLYMYKYNNIYKYQTLFTFDIGSEEDLLDGKEHIIEVDMTETVPYTYYDNGNTSCYRMKVSMSHYDQEDKLVTDTNHGLYPVLNNMSNWTAYNAFDRDPEVNDGNKDVYFVSNVVYTGIITLNSIILVEELSVC